MCRYCEMLDEMRKETIKPWSTSTTWGVTHLPEEKKTPEIDLSGLSENARDIIGLIRVNVRMGFTQKLEPFNIIIASLRHGVELVEVSKVLDLVEQIKTQEASKNDNPFDALIKSFS